MFLRNCPDCNKEIIYRWNYQLQTAIVRNSCCKSCRAVRSNISPKRNNRLAQNPSWAGYEEIPGSWFTKYFLRANKTKRTGTITIQDVWDLYLKQNKKCALSGVEISFTKEEGGYSASIDRIDSSKEYDLDNIQIVHKDVNIMKNRYNQDYFINFCKLISEKAKKDKIKLEEH